MDLFKKIKHIAYRPEFFKSRSFGAKGGLRCYSLLLLFFLAAKIIIALPDEIRFFQKITSPDWQKEQTAITDLYPAELKLSVKEGVVSTNVSEPYPIAIPKEWQSSESDAPKNFLVIDTTKPIETDDFAAQGTFLILGKNGFGYHDPKKGEFRIYDFRDKDWKGNMEIDREQYTSFITAAAKAIQRLFVIGFFSLPFLLYAFLWVIYLLYLVFGAVIVWIGARLQGHQISYGQAYAAGLYLIAVPFLYEFLWSYGQGVTFNIPFAFTIILFIMTLLNFPKAATPVTVAPQSSPEKIPAASTETTPAATNDQVS